MLQLSQPGGQQGEHNQTTKHLMFECVDLAEHRKRTKLFAVTMMGGTPTWEECLSDQESPRTRDYIRAVASRWAHYGKQPLLGKLHR